MPSASHWHGPIKWREISPSSRRLGGAEDQSYLQQSASGGTSPHYWTFWAANKLGGVNDGASFYLFFSLCSIIFLAKAVSVLPSLLFVELLSTLFKTFSVLYIGIGACTGCLFLKMRAFAICFCTGVALVTQGKQGDSRIKRLAWMKITQWLHSRHGDTQTGSVCSVNPIMPSQKRSAIIFMYYVIYYCIQLFPYKSLLTPLAVWCPARGEWSHCQLSKRVKFFHLNSLHVDDITPRFPSWSWWLLSSLGEQFDWYLKVPALEMQTPRGVVLINSPPVINGGGVREHVSLRDLLEVNQREMLGKMRRRSATLDSEEGEKRC